MMFCISASKAIVVSWKCIAAMLITMLSLSANPSDNDIYDVVVDDTNPGNLIHYKSFPSDLVEPRPVDVWLPDGYEESGEDYPVIYMHDGQMMFNRKTSPYAGTWNWLKYWIFGGVFWDVDSTMSRLIANKQIRPAIVVSTWMREEQRGTEFMPQKAVTEEVEKLIQVRAKEISRETITSDNYLKFLVSELKPFIDKTYRTRPGRDDTMIMGSSMGALISTYAISEYPLVFGAAACLSTEWDLGDGAVVEWYKSNWPTAGSHRLYFDNGTKSYDALFEPYQKEMDKLLRERGYREGADWVTQRFEGATHSPKSWRERLHVPLIFLLGDKSR